ncbi:hypothetical protein PXH69_24695 [Rhodococcus qingshengii]|uniref:Uncharacterized protein n=1 Tax=Rhodococcus qingshengii TaxID=334542 RepID=A0AAW6LSD3_RHOSG|nr:hypothetical protein [Rhodococcus qingshengii]MDE8648171.1 hypothetical protein [Rhodococcus qingshengii]
MSTEIPAGKLIIWRHGVPYMSRVAQVIGYVNDCEDDGLVSTAILARRDLSRGYEVRARHGQPAIRLRANNEYITYMIQLSVWRELMFVVAETDDELVEGIWVPMTLGKPARHA